MTDIRKERGLEIEAICKIARETDGTWSVPSQNGNSRYSVRLGAGASECHCDCPDHEFRGDRCKHMFAVEFVMEREVNADGSTTVNESVRITAAKRTTYPQNWPAYNEPQTNEKRHFQTLLHTLCQNVPTPPQCKGRQRMALSDAIFSVTFKKLFDRLWPPIHEPSLRRAGQGRYRQSSALQQHLQLSGKRRIDAGAARSDSGQQLAVEIG